jgi:hypothetical protein
MSALMLVLSDVLQIVTFTSEIQDCSNFIIALILLQSFMCLYHLVGVIAFQSFVYDTPSTTVRYTLEPWVFLSGTMLFMIVQMHKYTGDVFVFLPNYLILVLLFSAGSPSKKIGK